MTGRSAARITTADRGVAIRQWFARLRADCGAVDYRSARALFAPDVVSFGTKADVVVGLDALQRSQWEGIWPNIAAFRFDLDGIRGSGDARRAWGVATWTSTGFDARGRPFARPGRATVILERRGRAWVAAHTHFSLFPGTPPRTFAARDPDRADRRRRSPRPG